MVALHEVVHHDVVESRVPARQRLRVAVEVHHHEALPHLVAKLLERIRIPVESRRHLHLRCPCEMPVQAERPQVVRALQNVGLPSAAAHLHPAMRTVTRQHPDLGVPVTRDHQRGAQDVDAVVGARRGHLLDPAQRDPTPLEDPIDLGGVQIVAAVGLGRQRDRLVGRLDGTGRPQAGVVECHGPTLWALCCGSVSWS